MLTFIYLSVLSCLGKLGWCGVWRQHKQVPGLWKSCVESYGICASSCFVRTHIRHCPRKTHQRFSRQILISTLVFDFFVCFFKGDVLTLVYIFSVRTWKQHYWRKQENKRHNTTECYSRYYGSRKTCPLGRHTKRRWPVELRTVLPYCYYAACR